MSLSENRLLAVGLFTLWFCVVVVVVLVPSCSAVESLQVKRGSVVAVSEDGRRSREV